MEQAPMGEGEPRARVRRSWPSGLAMLATASLLTWAVVFGLLFAPSPGASAESEVRGTHLRVAFPADGEWQQADIHLLLYLDGSEPFEDVAADARDRALDRFPGGVEVRPGVTAQFELIGIRWDGNTASWSYNPAGRPSHTDGADHAALTAAAETWNAGGAAFSFIGGGVTSAGPGICNGSPDGQNTVGWDELGGGTLAMTCMVGGTTAKEFDIVFDRDRPWTFDEAAVEVDFESVALHEFGHALGLDHSEYRDAVMYWSYAHGSVKRDLHPDDIAGLLAIYGEDDEPPATPAPGAEPTPSPDPTPAPGSGGTPVEQRGVVPALQRGYE